MWPSINMSFDYIFHYITEQMYCNKRKYYAPLMQVLMMVYLHVDYVHWAILILLMRTHLENDLFYKFAAKFGDQKLFFNWNISFRKKVERERKSKNDISLYIPDMWPMLQPHDHWPIEILVILVKSSKKLNL